MSITEALGEEKLVELPAGPVAYRERGTGPALVFVHGVAVNGDLWAEVAPLLSDSYHCICPDLPWGSHSHPLKPDADLSLPGMARIVRDFLEELDLRDVTIVANDTGGAVSQYLVAKYAERVGRLVLTSCDAFEKFPPTPQKYLEVAARSRLLIWLVCWTAQFKFIQRLPTAYGFVTAETMDPAIMHSFTGNLRENPGVRRDFRRMLRAVDTRYTFEAAAGLGGFDKPALVIWGEQDKIFPREHGRRLANLLPRGEFELMPDSRTFVPVMQPTRLAERIRRFLQGGSDADVQGEDDSVADRA